jgi:hypothetical protein
MTDTQKTLAWVFNTNTLAVGRVGYGKSTGEATALYEVSGLLA